MREKFASELYELMKADENIMFITADVGYFFLDKIKKDFRDRFFNVGAAEQVMMDIAIGMTLRGKIAIVYSITPFLLFRPFESIRLYLDREKIPVVMVGTGRGNEYETASHYAGDDDIIKCFKNIRFIEEDDFNLREILYSKKPTYLNLKR
jgi:transketolase